MKKKAIFAGGIILTLSLVGSGVFLWQNSQTDVQALNKTLPDGVRVVKSLFGNEYRVVNKIDGYELRVPVIADRWKGLNTIRFQDVTNNSEVNYSSKIKENTHTNITNETILEMQEKNEWSALQIRSFKFNNAPDLKTFTEALTASLIPELKSKRFKISYRVSKIPVNNFTVTRAQQIWTSPDSELLSQVFYLFTKDSKIYLLAPYNNTDE